MKVRWKSISLLLTALVVLPLVLSQCRSRYKDVSHEPGYAERVGQRCTVVKGLRAHGFTVDLRRKDVTHEVAVTTLPGIGGPEITFKVDIPKGTTIVVTGVRECWNCPFDRIDYAIRIPELAELATHRVFARSDALAPDQVQCVKQSPAS